MSEALQNLEENLKQQTACYAELYDLEKYKQNALVANNIHEIDKITVREEQLVLVANHLERERLLLMEQVGRELGQEPGDLTLAILADRFPVLRKVHIDLERKVGQLQEIHHINTQLLQQSMKIVNFTIGLFMHQESNTTYSHPNHKGNDLDKKLHLLDRRI